MGQTYSVYLKVEFTDREKAADALIQKIGRADEEHVNYSLDHYKEIGIPADTIDNLLRIFFGGWTGTLTPTPDGALYSGFDASYGWEGVMIGAFNDISPFLKDGSSIKIYPDSGCDRARVKKGKVKWIS